ncbi:ATP-binding protein [Haloimpatiens sp. FM7315]|uniref:ATP-binding protein n=1 Tax=Haloimpatiens sp. FM7315 TaxID=3298609 RepID=UPI0035A2A3E0
MRKTLKFKFTLVHLGLVFIIAFMGVFSYYNFSTIRNSIDGFLTDNYKSINAANNMLDVIEKQNIYMVDYINGGDKASLDVFYNENNEFYKWFNIEWNNITEKDERAYVVEVKSSYVRLLASFSSLQKIRVTKGQKESISYYNDNIIPLYSKLTRSLRDLSLLNEKSMFNNNDNITVNTNRIMNLVLVLSLALVVTCFFIATFLVNKFLHPIELLTETMKLVKEGELDKEAPVVSNDEIGKLAIEFNNMTKRLKQFEQSTMGKLMNEKNKSIAIVKSISEPLMVLDENYKIVLINDKCEEFFSIDEKNVSGKHFLEAIRNGEIYDFIHYTYEEELEYDQKIFSIMHLGKENFFNITVTAIRDSSSFLEGVAIFFQNITELKSLEKVRADFVSSISHEFKTPITSLTFGASLLKNDKLGGLNDKQLEIVDTIQEEAYRLSELVTDLLKLSKVECEKPIFNMNNFNMKDAVLKSVAEFKTVAEKKAVNFDYNFLDNLKDVKGDFEKITWVLNNLISNAIKFTTKDGKITIRVWNSINKVYVSVKDTGVGIPEQYIGKIFEKFVRIPRDDEKGGTGLGLAICKQIVEVHGGEIWCKSSVGKGSEFVFYIPFK